MEDGTVSIFGLVFGVAATTSSSAAILIAGASGAAAAAVSMMAGAYLEAETTIDKGGGDVAEIRANHPRDPATLRSLLLGQLRVAGLSEHFTEQLMSSVAHDPQDGERLLGLLQTPSCVAQNPFEKALWMLLADFFSAAIPILPFVLLPVAMARIISALVTLALLALLGFGRARIGSKSVTRTIAETVSIGIAAAVAGVAIGMLIEVLTK
jgi:VIT1/CCC1 family predicted Fe2+/Mn2+ transporter